MAILMGEVVQSSIRELRDELSIVITEMKLFVEHCERACLIPRTGEAFVASGLINSMGAKLYKKLDALDKYKIFDSTVNEIAATVMDEEESVGVRLKQWMERSSMTVNEACQQFGRSKSTIYRWIKAGKLVAEKRDRRWFILAA